MRGSSSKQVVFMSGGITCEVRRLNISHMILKIVYLCLSEKTLKAVGSFYLVSMSGEVKDPDQVSFKAHLWKRTLTRTPTLGRPVCDNLARAQRCGFCHYPLRGAVVLRPRA